MRRRKFLVGIGSLAAGSAAVTGTGAFSNAKSERHIIINTAGDDSAYLKLDGDGNYVEDNSGELVIDLGGPETPQGGQGFNRDAATHVTGVVTVKNQGPEDLSLSLVGDGSKVKVRSNLGTIGLADSEGIYFSVEKGTVDSGKTANINVAVVEGVNDGDSAVEGGTLTIVSE